MNFDDILVKIGDFNRFQWTLGLVLLIPTVMLMPCFRMNTIFFLSTPDHWCYVPEVASSNLTLVEQQKLIRPPSNPSCAMYDVNYTEILESTNLTIDANWPTRPCNRGWQYDQKNYDLTATSQWNLVCGDAHYVSLVLTLESVGSTLGSPVFGFLSDRLGRKPTFFIIALFTGIAGTMSVTIPYFLAFVVLRCINGLTGSSMYNLTYILVVEFVGPRMRTRMNALSFNSWSFGMTIVPLVAWLTGNWVLLGIVTSLFPLGLLALWKLVPESPRWLISRKRFDEASAIMMEVSRKNGKMVYSASEMRNLLESVSNKDKDEASEMSNTPIDLLRYPQLRKVFIILTMCWIANRAAYLTIHFNATNLSGNEFLNFFLLGVVEMPANFSAWFVMNRLGRRCCSVSCLIITGAACLIFSFVSGDSRVAEITLSVIAKFGSISAFLALYQQAPELYPTTMRAIGISVSTCVSEVVTFGVPYLLYLGVYGKYIPFLVIASLCTFAASCASFLPETLNVNLPQTIEDSETFGSSHASCFSCRKRHPVAEKIQSIAPITNGEQIPFKFPKETSV